MICGQCWHCHRPPTRVTVVERYTTSPFLPPLPKINDKTVNTYRISICSTPYIHYLFYPIHFPHLVHYLFTIMTTCWRVGLRTLS